MTRAPVLLAVVLFGCDGANRIVLDLGDGPPIGVGLELHNACSNDEESEFQLVDEACRSINGGTQEVDLAILGDRPLKEMTCTMQLVVLQSCATGAALLLRSPEVTAALFADGDEDTLAFAEGALDRNFDADADGWSNYLEVANGFAASSAGVNPTAPCNLCAGAGDDDDATDGDDDDATGDDDASEGDDDTTVGDDDDATAGDDDASAGDDDTAVSPCEGVVPNVACFDADADCGMLDAGGCEVDCGVCEGLGNECVDNRCDRAFNLARWPMPDSAVFGCWDGVARSGAQDCAGITGFLAGQDGAVVMNAPQRTVDGFTVVDGVTGLRWERQETKATWSQAVAGCQAATTGGFDDWRLPSRIELFSLIDLGGSPNLDPVFPTPEDPRFWTSQASEFPAGNIHSLVFGAYGTESAVWHSNTAAPGTSLSYRCVRVDRLVVDPVPVERYVELDGPDVVQDAFTGLIWQGTSASPVLRTWEEAFGYCAALASGSEYAWRMPSAKELFTLQDIDRPSHYADDVFLLETGQYWSSTLTFYANSCVDNAWLVSVGIGQISHGGTQVGCTGLPTNTHYTLCVASAPAR